MKIKKMLICVWYFPPFFWFCDARGTFFPFLHSALIFPCINWYNLILFTYLTLTYLLNLLSHTTLPLNGSTFSSLLWEFMVLLAPNLEASVFLYARIKIKKLLFCVWCFSSLFSDCKRQIMSFSLFFAKEVY